MENLKLKQRKKKQMNCNQTSKWGAKIYERKFRRLSEGPQSIYFVILTILNIDNFPKIRNKMYICRWLSSRVYFYFVVLINLLELCTTFTELLIISREKKNKNKSLNKCFGGAYLNNGNSSKNQEKIVICQHLKYIGQIGCLTHKQLIEKKNV